MRKKAGVLFLLKCIKIPLSILLLSLTAKYFGVSVGREVWLLAFSTMMAIDAAFWGPINESFRAKFIFLKEEEGEEKAIKHTQSLLFYIFLFSVFMMLFITVFPQFTASVIVPKYQNQSLNLLIEMLVYAAPILLFNQAISIGNSILNAYEVFYVPEISSFINILINIFFLVLLTPFYGVYALLISYLISVIINISFVLFYISKTKIPLFKTKWNFKISGFKMYFIFAIPLFLPYFLGQINTIIEKSLATTIGVGTVSTMDYANRLPTMLYAVAISIISTILLPVLAESFAKKNDTKYIVDFQNIYQIGLLMLGFVIVFIIGASQPLMNILYQSKNISTLELSKIVILSKYYSVTLLGVFLYTIFGMSMMASGNNRKYAFLGIVAQLIVILINIIFVKILNIYVFPISITIAHVIAGYLMYKRFPFKNNEIIKISLKYLTLIILSSISINILNNIIVIKNNYFWIALTSFFQLFIMISLMYLMKIEELNLAFVKIKNILNKN